MRLDGAARFHEIGHTSVHGLKYMGNNELGHMFSSYLMRNDQLTWCVRLWGREVDECRHSADSPLVMELPN